LTIIIHIRCQYIILLPLYDFTYMIQFLHALVASICYCFTYALIFLPIVLFVDFLDGVLIGSFLLAEVSPPLYVFGERWREI